MGEAGDDRTFGAQVRRLRIGAGLTQEALAERSGLSANAISALERGERRHPYPHTIHKLANALNLSDSERVALTSSLPRRVDPRHDRGSMELPVPTTSLVGREQEVAEAIAILQHSPHRLLTLTGPGGVGKTRLALQLAAEMYERLASSVHFVSLAPIVDPQHVLTAIVQTLALQGAAGEGYLTLLARYFADRDHLLVLDNFEQVPGAAPLISDLLHACGRLEIVVTSRRLLRIDGEREFPVLPLQLPPPGHHVPLPSLAEIPAVALFQQRARAVRPDFELSEANAPAVIQLCTRLDGLPLAIELAAAWSRLLSPQAILGNLNNRLALLTGGGRDRPERLQTMRNAIAWSFDQLSPGEQVLFCRLSVFVGGCELEAAEAVAGSGEETSPLRNVAWFLTGVNSLMDHSLLQREGDPAGDLRIGMLETIRVFGFEQLQVRGEMSTLREAHARFYLAFASEARTQLEGAGRREAHTRIQRELDNIRAALGWLHESGDAENALLLATEMARFWVNFGYIGEGSTWMDRVLAMPGRSSPATRCEALYWAAILATLQDTMPRAIEFAREALDLARGSGNTLAIGMALGQLADAVGIDDPDSAQAMVEQSLSLFQDLGNAFREATAYRQLGLIERRRGNFDRALANHSTALEIWKRLDHPWGVPISLRDLGEDALSKGDLETARSKYLESLVQWRNLGERLHMSNCLSGLAQVALASGKADFAIVLLGAQETLDRAMGYVHTRAVHAALIDEAKAAVDNGTFNEMWGYGQSVALEDVLDELVTMGTM